MTWWEVHSRQFTLSRRSALARDGNFSGNAGVSWSVQLDDGGEGLILCNGL
jgi:hypothetical protein